VVHQETQAFGSNAARILVLDTQGAPAAGVAVRLSYCCPAGSMDAVTGKDGWAQFMLTPGTFHVELPGHTSQPIDITVPGQGGTALYIVHFREGQSTTPG
jgi:hypothetical protein